MPIHLIDYDNLNQISYIKFVKRNRRKCGLLVKKCLYSNIIELNYILCHKMKIKYCYKCSL